MSATLKKLKDQTIVITGASSGIGLATARRAAQRGARLVLAARSKDALEQLTNEIRSDGGEAVYVVADVSDPTDVHKIAQAAQDTLGGFDTWVNNAGISIYGKLEDIPIEDMRALFETNFWGVVYGSLEAVKHLKARGGGALINLGSTVSDRSLLLQGIYSASKHAIKGFTDALRMEVEHEGAPVSVTLVKPSAIDTPYPHHAKNYMDKEASLPPPVYAPDVVARAILSCATHPQRDLFVGAGGRQMAALGYHAAGLMDTIMEKVFVGQQKKESPPRFREQSGLDNPSGHLEERGGYEGHVAQSSLYTQASLHPVLAGAAALASAGLAAALWSITKNGT